MVVTENVQKSWPAFPRVVALDFDGTLTDSDRPSAEVLTELAATREWGARIVLVTGRILSELEDVFGDVMDHVDVIVAENGAVLATSNAIDSATSVKRLADQVSPVLVERLRAAGIAVRHGLVLVACNGADEHAVVDELARLGLECQLIRNRTELMVLPSGINKGFGLSRAVASLGLSVHDTVAVGDAENDHSLLEAAEVGVAVANAVTSLKTCADLVLDQRNGEGIVNLLQSLRSDDTRWAMRSRMRIQLGKDSANKPVELSARPSNVLVAGGSGDGKSYLAGSLAEQLIDLEYSVLAIDPEGDHCGLGSLQSAIVVGGDLPPAPIDVVMSLLDRNDTSVVVDLSSMEADARKEYLGGLPVEIEAFRRATGRPHWVLIDEAHETFAMHELAHNVFEPAIKGYCFVTWRPGMLSPVTLAGMDVVLAMTSLAPDDALIEVAAAVSGRPRAEIARLLLAPTGSVVVAERGVAGPPRVARLGGRSTAHFRHDHKYDSVGAPSARRFVFRSVPDHLTGATAANLGELEMVLAGCEPGVLRHHAPRRDVSSWILKVFHDASLAGAIRRAETTISSDSPTALVESARLEMINALRARRPSRN